MSIPVSWLSTLTALLLVALPWAASAQATPDSRLLNFVVFGAGDGSNSDATSFGNNNEVLEGLVGGNRRVVLGGGGGSADRFFGARAGHDLDSAGNNTNIGLGDVIVNNHAVLGPSATVRGNVDAQQATLGNNATIQGTLTLPAGVHPVLGSGASVANLVNSGDPAPRTFPRIVDLPGPSVFTPGTVDVVITAPNAAAAEVLPPGQYRHLTVDGNGRHLRLTAGTYVFDTITFTGGNTIHVDAADGDVLIFAAGNVAMTGNNNSMVLVGGGARNVYLESRGTVDLGNGTQWFGTVYSTKSDVPGEAGIRAGNGNTIRGTLYSRQQAQVGGSNRITYAVSDHFLAFFIDTPPIVAPTEAILNFAVFGAGLGAPASGTTFGNNARVFGGLVGSNRTLTIGGGGGSADHFLGIRAGANAITGGANVGSEGIVANEHVDLGSGTVVDGDVDASTARLRNNAAIVGTLTLPPGVSPVLGSGTSIGALVNDTPLMFEEIVMPPPSSFSASTSPAADVLVDAPNAAAAPLLAPGVYRDLISSGNARHLRLQAGTYTFRNILMTNSNHLHADAGQGDVVIFVEGDVSMGNNNRVHVTGGTAQNIYLETTGTVTIGGGVTWSGTLFSTKSDQPDQPGIVVGNGTEVTGALYSNQQVQLGSVTINRAVAHAFADKVTP